MRIAFFNCKWKIDSRRQILINATTCQTINVLESEERLDETWLELTVSK